MFLFNFVQMNCELYKQAVHPLIAPNDNISNITSKL